MAIVVPQGKVGGDCQVLVFFAAKSLAIIEWLRFANIVARRAGRLRRL